MDASAWVAVVAAVIALASVAVSSHQARTAARQADLAERQTELQKRALEDASQPYIWADFRLDPQHAFAVLLTIANQGSTLAKNVRVTFHPPLAFNDRGDRNFDTTTDVLSFSSMPPGRTMAWWLGAGADLMEHGESDYHVTINGEGPYGALPTLEYDLRLSDLQDMAALPLGTLKGLTDEVKNLTKAVLKAKARS